MLQTKTVAGRTFEILQFLMKAPYLADFHLAGGTALALYMGHRISVDLDLFTPYPYQEQELANKLEADYNFITDYQEKNTLKGSIEGIKIDCITFAYPLVKPIEKYDDIRLYSKEDIAAMKLSAIKDNGTRLKDFIDIAYLSTELSLSRMFDACKIKFPNTNTMIFEKALTFYEDINFGDAIELLNGTYVWKKIEKRLKEMISNPYIVFTSKP